MKDILFKLNMIKKNNQIVRLKKENQENNNKTQNLVDSYKKIVGDYQEKMQTEINNLNETIVKLKEEKSNLEVQCKFYKDCLDKIPKIILRVFVGKNKKLLSK